MDGEKRKTAESPEYKTGTWSDAVLQLIHGLLFLAAAIIALRSGWNGLRLALTSKDWMAAPGIVVQSEVIAIPGREETSYFPDVQFEYVVNDHRYTADTVRFGEYTSLSQRRAEAIVSRYPPGSRVTVYYNPENPETAVLERKATLDSYLSILSLPLCLCALPFLLVSLGAFFSLARRRR